MSWLSCLLLLVLFGVTSCQGKKASWLYTSDCRGDEECHTYVCSVEWGQVEWFLYPSLKAMAMWLLPIGHEQVLCNYIPGHKSLDTQWHTERNHS